MTYGDPLIRLLVACPDGMCRQQIVGPGGITASAPYAGAEGFADAVGAVLRASRASSRVAQAAAAAAASGHTAPLAVLRWITERVQYAPDAPHIEQIRTPERTIEEGRGDCEDVALLAAAMLHQLGVEAAVSIEGYTPSGTPQHAVALTAAGEVLDATIGRGAPLLTPYPATSRVLVTQAGRVLTVLSPDPAFMATPPAGVSGPFDVPGFGGGSFNFGGGFGGGFTPPGGFSFGSFGGGNPFGSFGASGEFYANPLGGGGGGTPDRDTLDRILEVIRVAGPFLVAMFGGDSSRWENRGVIRNPDPNNLPAGYVLVEDPATGEMVAVPMDVAQEWAAIAHEQGYRRSSGGSLLPWLIGGGALLWALTRKKSK